MIFRKVVFAHAVTTHETDFVAWIEGQVDIREQRAGTDRLRDVFSVQQHGEVAGSFVNVLELSAGGAGGLARGELNRHSSGHRLALNVKASPG